MQPIFLLWFAFFEINLEKYILKIVIDKMKNGSHRCGSAFKGE